jgi:hypothetical protein
MDNCLSPDAADGELVLPRIPLTGYPRCGSGPADVGGRSHPEATMTATKTTKTRTCAACGGRAVPIVYGMPMYHVFEAAERGEVVLGGCEIIVGETPAWRCLACTREFGQVRLS